MSEEAALVWFHGLNPGGLKKRPAPTFDVGLVRPGAIAYRATAAGRYRGQAVRRKEFVQSKRAQMVFLNTVAGTTNYSQIFNDKATEAAGAGKTLIIGPGEYYIPLVDWSAHSELKVEAEPGAVLWLDSASAPLKLSSGGKYHNLKIEHYPNRAAPLLAIDVIQSGIGNSGVIDGLDLEIGSGVDGVRLGAFTGFSVVRSQIRGGNGSGSGLILNGHWQHVIRTAVTDWDTQVEIKGTDQQSLSFAYSTFEGGATGVKFSHTNTLKGTVFDGCHAERLDVIYDINADVRSLAVKGGMYAFDRDPMRFMTVDAVGYGIYVSGCYGFSAGGDRVIFEVNNQFTQITEVGNWFENVTVATGDYSDNVYSIP